MTDRGTLENRRGRGVPDRLVPGFLAANEKIWNRLPVAARRMTPIERYGSWLHGIVTRQAAREMYLGTHFLRNRPELELMARLLETQEPGSPVRVSVLGCSIGVEVYSIAWTLRKRRPDLEISIHALDISPDAIRIGAQGVYDDEAVAIAGWPIFSGLSPDERVDMFDWDGVTAHVKPWLRDRITWQVGNAGDPMLVRQLAKQDIVVANNFLCHMPAPAARSCLRNLAQLVDQDGHLFVTGVDLDVRERTALELGWEPVPELLAEIHEGDPLVRADWPLRWWGLEPLDRRRPGWEMRYSAVFRIRDSGDQAPS